MDQNRYVLRLIEDSVIGYWDGKKYRGDDVIFPGVTHSKHDERVKVYTSKKRAENAVEKLKDKFTFVTRATIETLD